MEYLVKVSEAGKRQTAHEAELREYWKSKVHIGQRLADGVSGIGGQVYRIHPWGVEVWVDNRKGEREIWTWGKFIRRQPRLWKRHPRTGRFPRLTPTKQCHCKAGEIKIVRGGDHAVRCKTCRQLIGNESFPSRFRKATKLLRLAALKKNPKTEVHSGNLRSRNRKAGRHRTAIRKQNPSRMGVRSVRPTAKRSRSEKTGAAEKA